MKQRFLAGVATVAILTMSASASAQNIFEALSQTYNTNPTLQAQRAYLRSVDENVALAKSGYRPTIALVGSYSDSSNEVENNNVSSDNDYDTQTIAAKISQPLFSGFSTVNSVKSADQAVRAEQNNLYNVEQSVFLDASTAYLDVVRDMAIVELQKNNEKLLKKRLDETRQRFNVGEVTRTDVSQAKARYSQAKSDRISSEGTLEASKAVYTKIIGTAPETLDDPTSIKDFLPSSYDEALGVALKNNYSIRQARHLFNAKGYEVYANTGALFPQLSFDASASKVENSNDNHLVGDTTTEGVEWGLNLNVPLYDAGANRAKIRQSKHQKWQAQEIVLETERAVKATVSSAWEYMKSNESKIFAIKDQVKANKIALEGVQKEEALGNRTILDVLDAYQELLNSNVNEVKARRDYYVSAMQLLLSMGRLTAKDLKLGVDLYDAKEFYKDTKGKWLSLN
ncbi:MAG: hypothetical protein E7018_01590 [Alphaproteobacteria bacterium]|nr:hypothetical protein [Alphaproteobacteria bacterium]